MVIMTNEEAARYLKYGIESSLNGTNKHNLDYLCRTAIEDGECTLTGVSILNRDEKEKWVFTIKLENQGALTPEEEKVMGE